MATLIHDCPYCGASRSTFNVVNAVAMPTKRNTWTVFLTCNNCWNGIVAKVFDGGTGQSPVNHPASLDAENPPYRFTVLDIRPRASVADIPGHLSDSVAKCFKEGCDVLRISPSAACSQFRKTLELALKDLSPDIEAWKLEKRIDQMAQRGLLTESLKTWAHKLRLDGNGSVHEDADVTHEFAMQMESLTRFVLLYLFTLPRSVEEAQHAIET